MGGWETVVACLSGRQESREMTLVRGAGETPRDRSSVTGNYRSTSDLFSAPTVSAHAVITLNASRWPAGVDICRRFGRPFITRASCTISLTASESHRSVGRRQWTAFSGASERSARHGIHPAHSGRSPAMAANIARAVHRPIAISAGASIVRPFLPCRTDSAG